MWSTPRTTPHHAPRPTRRYGNALSTGAILMRLATLHSTSEPSQWLLHTAGDSCFHAACLSPGEIPMAAGSHHTHTAN